MEAPVGSRRESVPEEEGAVLEARQGLQGEEGTAAVLEQTLPSFLLSFPFIAAWALHPRVGPPTHSSLSQLLGSFSLKLTP